MRRPPASFRFFSAVSPPAPPLVAVLATLALGGAVLEKIDRGSSDWVLASIALIQLFAVSTGFTRHACRGYYDPVLLGRGRAFLAMAHFAASAAPGAVAWTVCGVAQAAAAGSAAAPAFRPAGLATLLLTSAIPWASSVRAGPYLGGALWLMVSIALVASGRVLESLARLHVSPAWGLAHPVEAFGVGLGFPVAIPSLSWPAGVLVGFVATSFVAIGAGIVTIVRADFPLAEEGW